MAHHGIVRRIRDAALAALTIVIVGMGCGNRDSSPVRTTAAVMASAQSPLAGAGCTLVEYDHEVGSSTQLCEAVGGYTLLVLDDDARMSVTVVAPDGRRQPLELWHVVTRAFSHLGDRAEWWLRDGVPIALIVPVIVTEGPDEERTVLAVARIVASGACVVARVPDGPTAAVEARAAADKAQAAPCVAEVD